MDGKLEPVEVDALAWEVDGGHMGCILSKGFVTAPNPVLVNDPLEALYGP